MKSTGGIVSAYISLLGLLSILYSCQSRPTFRSTEFNPLIDSLIQINRINDRTIVVSFGADAISAINTEDGIVIIDAGISTGLTEKFREKIENEFNCSNISYVINTHAHPDHYGGNSVFSESQVIGQVNGFKEIDNRLAATEEKLSSLTDIIDAYDSDLQSCQKHSEEWIHAFTQRTRYQYAYNDVKHLVSIKKPDITFSDSLVLTVGNIRFEMKYFGKCHSSSDIFVCVPELGLLFSGDLISEYGRPSINDRTMSEKEQWYQAIQWLERRLSTIEDVVTGHGQLLSTDDLSSFSKMIVLK